MKHLTKTLLAFLSLSLLISCTTSSSLAQNNTPKKDSSEDILAPFPRAEEGMVRHVIELEKKADESLYKVEIIPGKVMSVDCNIHRLMGSLTEQDLQGWGYTYYEFKSDGQTTSTMMACNKPKEDKFVSGETLTVRYNSKLPIVIYAPLGFDVKYRIWTANEEKNSVEK